MSGGAEGGTVRILRLLGTGGQFRLPPGAPRVAGRPGGYWELKLGVKDDEQAATDAPEGVPGCRIVLIEPILKIENDTGSDYLADDLEYTPGAFMWVGELRSLHFEAAPPVDPIEGTGVIKLEVFSGASKIKLWTDSTKTTQYNTDNTYPTDESVTICVEGIEASAAVRDVELRLYYIYGGVKRAYDSIRLSIIPGEGVVIDVPGSYPALVCKGATLQLGSTVWPPELRGGTYQWSKLSGPGAVTFTPSATVEDPQFSADEVGKYAVKVEYTKNGNTFSDTTEPGTKGPNGEIVVWKMRYDEDPTHVSIEGYPAGGGMMGDIQDDYGIWAPSQNLKDERASLTFNMQSDGKGFVDEYGAGSKLRVSGEKRWNVYIDIGNASVALKVSGTWQGSGNVAPVSTLMERGTLSICHVKPKSGEYQVLIVGGTLRTQSNEGKVGNPITWSGLVDGDEYVGFIEAGVGYDDHGADPGMAVSGMVIDYSVSAD